MDKNVLWIIVIIGIIIIAFILFRKKTIIATSPTIGKSPLAMVPGYNQAIKAASIVEKPAAHLFNAVNNGVTSALQHIPVAGKILSIPTKVAGTVVNDTLKFLGF